MARRPEPSSWLQQAGLLTAIPIVLLVGPALGYYLGVALDERWAFEPWGMAGGIALGFAASIRVVVQFIQRANALERTEPPNHHPRKT